MNATEDRSMPAIVSRLFRVTLLLFVFLCPVAVQAAAEMPTSRASFSGQQLKTIIVDNYQPYTFLNEKGEPDGFSVEIARAVARVMDFELVITANTWEVAQKSLENGDIDLLPMMAFSKERDRNFDFSVPHTIAYDTVFYRKSGANPRSLADLEGKKVLVMNRDAAHEYLVSSGLANKMRLQLVESLPEALRQLALGNAEAAIMPKLVGMVTAKKLNLPDIETSPRLIDAYNRPFSFAVKDGNQALLERLNQGLNIIKSTGQYDTIYKKWFGELEGSRIAWADVIKVIALAGIILLALLAWNLSLNRKVKLKTRHLEAEIAQRKQAEEALQETNENLEGKVAVRTQELEIANEALTAQNEEATAMNEELVAQNEEISSMNKEIESLNQTLTSLNESLEQRIAVRTADLAGANQELIAQYDELRQLQEAQRRSNILLEQTFEQSPVPMVLVSMPDAIFQFVNPACRKFLRIDEKPSLVGTSLMEFEPAWQDIDLDGKEASINELPLARSLRGIKTECEERRIIHKDGTISSELVSGAPIFDDAGNVIAGYLIMMDVTERMRREQELKRDAQLATRVQKALLSVPEPSDCLDIAKMYQPSGYVGGDLYFLDWRYDGTLLRGFLVDAVGHGLGTALHTASLHVLLREVNERDLPLSDAMRWLNRRAGEYFDEANFAGAIGFELDLQTRQLRWVCAGITKVHVAAKAQQGVMECAGMCLGIHAEEIFDLHTMPIDIGDSFYFMTDGLAELLDGRPTLPLDRYQEMVQLLRSLSESEGRRDDATAVCIHVRALPQSSVRQDGWPRIIRFNGYGDYQRLKGEVAKILAEVTGLTHSMHEVVVNEALANAMECRDGVPRHHKARLRFNKVGNRLIVRVKTSRIGFAGNAILKRLRSQPEDMFSFGEDASMGRGIPMMLSMSHQMTYNSEGTEVLLAWKL